MTILESGIAAAVIPCVVEIFKKFIDTRWSPLIAFLIGGILGYVNFHVAGGDIVQQIFAGISIGGISTGLYAVVNTSIRNK